MATKNMNDNESRKWLFGELKSNGYDVGKDYDEFSSLLDSNKEARQWCYDTATGMGLNVGKDYDEFDSVIGNGVPSPTVPLTPVVEGSVKKPHGGDDPGAVVTVGHVNGQVQAWKPSREDLERYGQTLAEGSEAVRDVTEGMETTLDYMRGSRGNPLGRQGVQPGVREEKPQLGANKNVVRGEDRLNTGTEKLEPTYLTQGGNVYGSRMMADSEQDAIDRQRAMELDPIGMQLEEAYAERERLNARLAELGKQEDKKNDTALRRMASLAMPTGGATYGSDLMKMRNVTSDEYQTLHAAADANEKRILNLEALRDKEEAGFFRGIADAVRKPGTWDFGFADLNAMAALTRAKGTLERGEGLDSSERALLRNTLAADATEGEVDKELGNWYRWGQMTGASSSFALDMIGGNTLFGGLTRAGKYAGLKIARKAALTGMKRALLKNTGIALGDLGVAAATTLTVQHAKTGADIAGRHLGHVSVDGNGHFHLEGGEKFLPATVKGFNNMLIENYTEKLGDHIPGFGNILKDGLGKLGLKGASEWLTKVGGSDLYRVTKEWLGRAGINGLGGEILEEEINVPLNALFVGDNEVSDLWDARTQADIVFGTTLSVAAMNGATLTGAGALHGGRKAAAAMAYYQYKRGTDKAGRMAAFRLTESKWAPLRDRIDGTSNDGLETVWEEIRGDKDLSVQEKKAVLKYMNSLVALRGFNLGQAAAGRNAMGNPVAEGINSAYVQGHGATDEQKPDIKVRYDYTAGELRRQLGLNGDADLEREFYPGKDAGFVMESMKENGFTEEQVQKALDYFNAKAAYEGMIAGVRERAGDAVSESDLRTDVRTNRKDGMLHPATMKLDNRKVYVVDGHVAMMEDGTMVDNVRSDESIIIVDAETGKPEYSSPDQVLRMENPVDAAEEKRRAADEVRGQYEQRQADLIDGVLGFQPGDVFSIAGEDGAVHEVQVAGPYVDGQTGQPVDGQLVVNVDGQQRVMPKGQLQEGSDALRLQRLQESLQERAVEQVKERNAEENMGISEQGMESSISKKNRDSIISDEKDDNGHPFVLSQNGTTSFGEITTDSGLKEAPIKLSVGFNKKDERGNNIGYGLEHIKAGHGEQILKSGYASVEEFVEDVTRNYQEIRIGRNRRNHQTYMLLELHDEKHKRTLFVELSHDGAYWNVNSGGIFNNRYVDKKDIVWPEPTMGDNAITDATGVVNSPTEVAIGETVDRGGNSPQPISYVDKVSDNTGDAQRNGVIFSLNDVVTLRTPDGDTVDAVVNGEASEENGGLVEVELDHAVPGMNRIGVYTPEELTGMMDRPVDSALEASGQNEAVNNDTQAGENYARNSNEDIQENGERNGITIDTPRSLTTDESERLIATMEANAEVAPEMELTPENWIKEFGEDGKVSTPIGKVKMGENQLAKLFLKQRDSYFSMIKPTLENPDVIIEKPAPTEGAERNTKLLFIRSFIKPDGSRIVHFESVTVRKDGMEVSISSHEVEDKAIKKEVQNGKILHLSSKLFSGSDRYLTEAPIKEGSDLVPTPNAISSASKNTANVEGTQAKGEENVEPMPMKGEDPDFSRVDAARARLYIYGEAGLTREEANAFVKANADAAAKAVEKLRKGKPKMGTSIAKYRKEQAAWQQKVEDADRAVAYWNKVKAEQQRVVGAERAEQAEKEAALHAEAVKDEAQRKQKEAVAEAERQAVGVNNPMPAITGRWKTAPKVDGVEDEMVLPNGERVSGHYVLTESGAASASHQALNGFAQTEGFPMDERGGTVNDRDYERDKDAQRVTRDIAAHYDSRALQTPVVVSQDGVVLSGNGRTMAGEIAASENTDGAYNDYLKQYAGKYGFTTEQVGGMKHPRVVFVPDARMPYTAETFSKFNQQEMKSQSRTEHAVKLGKIVDDATFGRIVRSINGFDTLGDFYNNPKAATEALKELQGAGVVPHAQLAEMFDGDSLSDKGRELLENTLTGKVFEENPDAVRMITEYKQLRQSVITALAEISNNLALGKEYALTGELSEAVKLCYQARKSGFKAGDMVSAYARQGNLFRLDEGATVADYTNAMVLMLADVLNDNRVTRLKKVLALYNDSARDSANGQLDIFSGEVKTQEEVLNDILNLLNYGAETEQRPALDGAADQRKGQGVQENGTADGRSEGSERSEDAGKDSGHTSSAKDQSQPNGINGIADPREMPMEERIRRGDMLRDAHAVNVAEGQIVSTPEMSARKAAEQWWNEHVPEPAYYETEVGVVEIGLKSIEDSLAHRYGQARLDAITSLVNGFGNAVYLGTMPDSRERGVTDHYFAYPIIYKSKRCYVFCRTMQDANKNRLYVHEVFVADRIEKGNTLQTAASKPHGGISLYRDILANVLEVPSAGKVSEEFANDQRNGEENEGKNEGNQLKTTEVGDKSLSLHEEQKARNNDVSESIPQGNNGTLPEKDASVEAAAAGLQDRIEAATRDAQASGRTLSGRERQELTERAAESYAREKGLWIPMQDVVLSWRPLPGGKENDVYLNPREGSVYKVNNLMNSKGILPLFDRIRLHNQYFPQTKYSLVGFTGFGNGSAYPVFSQNYVHDATFATPEEIDQYMTSLGFAREGEASYGNGDVTISDLRPRNVLKDGDGDIYVVDAEFRENDHSPAVGKMVAAAEAATEAAPSDAQKEAGNYKKGHVRIDGYDISIENPRGSVRSGTDADGKKWSVTMNNTYGYIKGTRGVDGDHIDVFLSDDMDGWDGRKVFVVDQTDTDGGFDEHKCMIGFNTIDEAEAAYYANYSPDWKQTHPGIKITGVNAEDFGKWIDSSHRKTKPFSEYKGVKGVSKVVSNETRESKEVNDTPRGGYDEILPVGHGKFGDIYDQFKGKVKEAIAFLTRKRNGEAIDVLHHTDIDGGISLVWGNERTGLEKIIQKHPEVLDNLQEIIDGMHIIQETGNRIKLESDTHFAVISKEYMGKPRDKWLLTAYEKKNSALDNTMDTGKTPKGNGNDTATPESTVISGSKDNTVTANDKGKGGKSAGAELKSRKEKINGTSPDKSDRTDESDAYALAEESKEIFADKIAESSHEVEIDTPRVFETGNTIYAPLMVDGKKTSLSLYQAEPGLSTDEVIKGVAFTRSGLTYDDMAMLEDKWNEHEGRVVCRSDEDALQLNFGSVDDAVRFEKWIDSSQRKTKPFSEYKGVKGSGAHGHADDGLLYRSGEGMGEINAEFNDRLSGLTTENADRVTLSLGRPSDVLVAAGVEDKPMKLYGNKVMKKMRKHGFTLNGLRDLPRAVADPIAVFNNYQKDGNRTILTELRSRGNNIMVAVTLGKNGVDVDFNIISSVFGKGESNILEWINKGYATYINREKALRYLHFSESSISEASNNEELNSATKVIENFENPSVEGVKNEDGLLYRSGGGMGEINTEFNDRLSGLTTENADRVTLSLGRPSDVLVAAGVEDKPMKLYGNKVMKKMRKHGFTLDELRDLPRAVADPIAVFKNYGADGNRSVLTEMRTSQGNFLVTLSLGRGNDVDFNVVTSVFGKGRENIIDWINRGFMTYVDKEKALNYLHHSALKAVTSNSEELNSATKIVENFENPSVGDVKNEDGLLYRSEADNMVSTLTREYGLDEQDVQVYADAMRKGQLGNATRAEAEIRRKVLLNGGYTSLGALAKAMKPIREALYANFGNVEELRQEYIDRTMAERGAMEAARKKAEEAAEAERKRLREFELMDADALDSEYMKTLETGDEKRMRDLVNEAARRNGYVSDGEFRMAHRAPSYDETGTDKSLTDVARNKDGVRESLDEQLRMGRDASREESSAALEKAFTGIGRGENPMVKVYRAVPKGVKEGKMRNGDWVTLSRHYAEMHGNNALKGDYRIMEQEVPAGDLYWDANDVNEWGYDDRSDYAYRNTKNNRKLRELVTRDNKGNVIPLSKRFNPRKSDERYRLGDATGTFSARQWTAVKNKGTVMPGLNEADVKVVQAEPAGFGNFAEAKEWAKEHIARTYSNEETGGKGKVRISNTAIDKFLSEKAVNKSSDLSSHLAVLKVLPEIIETGVEAEEHPDYKKIENGRTSNTDINPDVLIHRLYGAANINGKIYRVKITLKEYAEESPHKAYSYEATKIELLAGLSEEAVTSSRYSNSSIPVAKLLEGVEKSYDKGKKLLEESGDLTDGDKFRTAKEFADGEELEIDLHPQADGKWLHSVEGLSGQFESEEQLLDAFRNKYPQYLAALTEDRLGIVVEPWSKYLKGSRSTGVHVGRKTRQAQQAVQEMAERLHLNDVEVLATTRGLTGAKARAKGWYDPKRGKIVIVLPNHTDVGDVMRTLLHEGVAHHGLRRLMGEHFDTFLDNVLANAEDAIASRIREQAGSRFMDGVARGSELTHEEALRIETEEYLASLAEDTNFEQPHRSGWWQKLKGFFLKALAEMGVKLPVKLTDNELRYILWRSYENLKSDGRSYDLFDTAEDVAMQGKLKVGDYAVENDVESRVAEDADAETLDMVNERFNEELERHQKGEMGNNDIFHLGKPQGAMKLFLPDFPIIMRQRVITKGTEKKHNVSAESLRNIPQMVSSPIMIFRRDGKTIGILTEMMDRDGKNVCVAIEMEKAIQDGKRVLTVNDVRSFHGREIKNIVLPILNNGTLRWVDKEKALDWFSSASQQVQQEITNQELDSATKIVENFENPSVEGVKNGDKVENHVVEDADAETLDMVNERFNEELNKQISGKLPQGHVYQLGMPSLALLSTGIPALPIELSAERLATKASKEYASNHPFDLQHVVNLPEALAHPIAIFNSRTQKGTKVVLTELKEKGNNFIAAIRVRKSDDSRKLNIEVNSIRSLYPKESKNGILNWVNDGLLVWVDKKKTSDFFSTQWPNYIAGGKRIKGFSDAAKVIENFENPSVEGVKNEDNLRFRSTIEEPGGGVARDYYERKVREPNRSGSVKKVGNFIWRMRKNYLDSMAALEAFTQAVLKETGDTMQSHEDAYKAENRMSSMNKVQAEVFERDYTRPLWNAVLKLIDKGNAYEAVKQYLVAKHGLERNVVLAKRDFEDYRQEHPQGTKTLDDFRKKDYSGLTALTGEQDVAVAEDRARKMVDDFEGRHGTESAELWRLINAATKATLKKGYDSGLMGKAQYEHVRDMFEYYIPLRGWDENVAAEEYNYYGRGRAGSGKLEMKTAKGRTSLSDDPIAQIGFMGEKAIQQGNRNVMKRHFLNFVLNHPTNLASVGRQWYIVDAAGDWVAKEPPIPPHADGDTVAQIVAQHEADMEALERQGLAKTERGHLKLGLNTTEAEQNEHKVKVLVGGKERVIYINGNPAAAQAVNGVTNPDVGKGPVERKWDAFQRKFAGVLTSYNPTFVVRNLSMDTLQAAAFTLVREDAAYSRKALKNAGMVFGKAMMPKLLLKWNRGTLDMGNDVERYFNEFMQNGGETGFTQLNTVDDFKRKMERFVKEAEGGTAQLPAKAWHALWDGVEFMNRAAEDANRFICYMTSRQLGRDVARSVYDAKEITVNFNKKGAGGLGGRQMSWAYLFFNAAMQSVKNFGKVVGNNPRKGAALIGCFAASGLLMPMLNGVMMAVCRALTGDGGDEDDWYWDQPEWVRRSNVMLYVPFTKGKFLTIPLPHELRPFYGMGECAYAALCGGQGTGDALLDAVAGFSSMFPLDFTGNGGDAVLNLTPSLAQPAAQVIANKSYFGQPVYRRNDYAALDPEWTKAYKGTNRLLMDGSRMLNSLQGGDAVHKGRADGWWTNPDVWEHFIESYFGGMGKTVNKTAKTVSMLWDEDARVWRNVPVMNSFMVTTDERSSGSNLNGRYYDFLDEFMRTEHDFRGYRKQAGMGSMEYAEKLDAFMRSPAFRRYEAAYGYKVALDRMRSALQYMDATDREAAEQQMTELKREMLRAVEVE